MNATTHPKRRLAFLVAIAAALALLGGVLTPTPATAAGTSSISGRVILGDGNPAPPGTVTVSYTRSDGTTTSPLTTGATTSTGGAYSITGLSDGVYELHFDYTPSAAYLDGWHSTRGVTVLNRYADGGRTFTLSGTAVAVADITMPRPLSQSGRVMREDGAPANARVTAYYDSNDDPFVQTMVAVTSALTDSQGRYTLTGLLNTQQRFVVEYLGAGAYLPAQYPVNGSGSVGWPETTRDFELLYDNRLSGRVTLPNGTPVVGATVRVQLAWNSGVFYFDHTDSDGRYEISGILSDVYDVRILSRPAGWNAPKPDVTVDLTRTQLTRDFVLQAVAAISGTVRGDAAAPLSGVTVTATAYDLDGEFLETFTQTTDHLGRYNFPALYAGYWEVIADDGNGPYAAVTWDSVNPYYWGDVIELDDGETHPNTDFTLPRAGVLQGTVAGADLTSADLGLSLVELFVYDGFLDDWVGTNDRKWATSTGTFAFTDLHPGDYRLEAVYGGIKGRRSVMSDVITVGAGATSTVPLTFPAGTPWEMPRIPGPHAVGTPMTLDLGSWETATDVEVAWYRCASFVAARLGGGPEGCTPIYHDELTLVPSASLADKWVLAIVVGTFEDGQWYLVNSASVLVSAVPPQPSEPVVVQVPLVSGTPSVGSTWTLSAGSWSGYPTPTFTRNWVRCNQAVTVSFGSQLPSGCTTIPGATGTTYVTTQADVGKYVTAAVTATNSAGTYMVGGPTGAQITAAPTRTAAPTVSGTATVGTELSSNRGTWTGAPTPTVTRVWLRCTERVTAVFTSIPAHCAPISGATSAAYVVTNADAGKYLTIFVTATNTAGTATAGAVSTALVPVPATAAPKLLTVPTVTGTAAVGSTLSSNRGTWSGTPTPTITRAWYRCAERITAVFTVIPGHCTAIPGATGATYVATTADAGMHLTIVATAVNSVATVTSGAVSTAPLPKAPAVTADPAVTGSAVVGATLTLAPGTWTGTPTPTLTRAWLRCTAPITTGFASIPASCSAISGATGATYVLTTADLGFHIAALVTATNSAGTTRAGALSTAAVASLPKLSTVPTVTGTATVGATLSSNRGTWTGTPTPTVTRVWLRCTQRVTAVVTAMPSFCTPIAGATSATYVVAYADAGKYLTVFATATNAAGSVTSGAVSTVLVPVPATSPPVQTNAPKVTGTPTVGVALSSNRGIWTGAPTPTITRAWARCDAPVTTLQAALPAGCTLIPGATGSTYTPTMDDLGAYLTILVTATNTAGTVNSVAVSSPAVG